MLTLDSPELTSKIEGSAEQFAGLAAELRRAPFLFSLRDGRLVETRMPRTITPFAGAILLTIASQFQLPQRPPEAAVELQEHDGTGDYAVRYEPGASATQLKKTKLRYGKLLAVGKETQGFSKDALLPKVEQSSSLLDVQGGLLRSVAFEETLSSQVFGTGEIKGHTLLTLKLMETKNALPHDISELYAQTSRYEVGKPFFQQSTLKLFDEVRLDGRTFDQISTALGANKQDPRAAQVQKGDQSKLTPAELKDREDWLRSQTDAFGGLVALYREKPESIKQAEEVIRKGGANSAALLDGLATAGTPESNRVLIQIMQDTTLDDGVRGNVAATLFRTRRPNAEVARATEAALDDPLLSVQAMYAAGTFARILREAGDSASSKQLVTLLLERLKVSTTPDITVHLLRGISNSAYSGAIPAIEARLQDPHPDVRSAAIDAFRMMEDPRVDALIAAQILRPRASTDYRLSALGACNGRRATLPLVDAAIDRALHDESKSMRFNAIALLGSWKDEFPAAIATLKKISETDSDAETREAARIEL